MAILKDEVKAFLIIVISVVVLSAFVIVIGGTQFFDKYDTYYTKVANAAGLETGAQVRIGGVRAGRVQAITPPSGPGELVTIVLGIKEGTKIYKGTRAVITQVGFVGDIYLLLSVRDTVPGTFKPGDTIPAESPVDYSELLAGVNRITIGLEDLIANVNRIFSDKNVAGVEQLLKNTDKTITSAGRNLDEITWEIKEVAKNLQSVLDEIKGFVQVGGEDFSSLTRQAKKDFSSLTQQAKKDFSALAQQASRDLEEAEKMITAIKDAANKVGNATDTVESAVDRQSRNLDSLVMSIKRTMRDLQDVLQELKLKPWSIIYKEAPPREN